MSTTSSAAPPVVSWYRIYAGAMALLYLACIVAGIFLLIFSQEIAAADPEMPSWMMVFYGAFIIGIGLVLAAAYAAALFLPPRPWTWIYHLVLIGIGMTSCCCIPAAIPLIIYWLKPETQAWFGRGPLNPAGSPGPG